MELSVLNLKELTYCWLYEGKNGSWWLKDERIPSAIVKGYHEQKESVPLQISGFIYIVDL